MDIKNLMKQAQAMQSKMQEAQQELQDKEFEGTAGGGMVKFTANGSGQAKKIVIDESLLEKEDKDVLEDLIVAAFNDAKKKADESSSDILQSAAGGLNLPKGFGF